ncbi:glutamate racemase [Alteribacter keqinensis]|uniref:Glutamate racemase n=1 Tax=Alteribacter keqinensis TaxID=2483800 RepID=A0A3M7TPM2_9BACI|nr:glutamate racemase [Alteribacter keqinensis]RNA67586.1 glutamate racemase [Alteribacter keqinensis]
MEKAIGVIDSGIGGLTVAHELMRQLPKEKIIYLGDTLRCPYGPRPQNEVKEFTWNMVNFLLERDIKALVIACNTATAYTLGELKQKLNIPVIGVVQPGARAAINITKSNKVGIIGTEGTINSNVYNYALKKINPNIKVHSLACPLFAPMIEQGLLSGKSSRKIVKKTMDQMHKEIDTLILGCTHYPLIKNLIQEMLGNEVTLVSSSEETAREVSTILEVTNMLNQKVELPKHEFYTTGKNDVFIKVIKDVLGFHHNLHYPITTEKAVI